MLTLSDAWAYLPMRASISHRACSLPVEYFAIYLHPWGAFERVNMK